MNSHLEEADEDSELHPDALPVLGRWMPHPRPERFHRDALTSASPTTGTIGTNGTTTTGNIIILLTFATRGAAAAQRTC